MTDQEKEYLDSFRFMAQWRYREVGLSLTPTQLENWTAYYLSEIAKRGLDYGYQSAVGAVANARDRGVFITPSEEIAIAREAAVREAQAIQAAINAREAAAAAQVQAEAEAIERLKAVDNAAAFALMQQRYIESQAAAAQKAAEEAAYQARYEELQAQARMQTMPITTLQTEAELEAQAQIIEDQRAAVLDTGAANADKDFLMQQAQIDAQQTALFIQQADAQAALDMQSGAALQAYAVEVRADVADMYRQILKREADQGGLDYWTSVIVNGDATGELVAIALSQSEEAIILGAYEQYLFRVPSMDERNYWINAIVQHGLPVDQAISYIANSEEAQQYHAAIVPTPGADPLIVQTINPVSGSAQAIDPIMGTSTWGASYTNQDMIAADPVASPVIQIQNYYNPDVNISDLEPVSPIGDTSPALAFKARDEIYKAYTTNLKREPSEADYQYWEPLLVAKDLSLSDFKRYVAESEEAKALVKRTNDASLTDAAPPEVVADLTKKSEGVGAAVGLLSALAFFLGQ